MSVPLWMAALLAAAVVVPVPWADARAAPATARVEQARRVRLEIDVDGLRGYEGFDPAAYEAMVRLALTDALRGRSYEVIAPGDAAAGEGAVILALSWRDFDASSFALAYSVQRDGGDPRAIPVHTCERCGDDELVAAVESHLDEALAALEREATPSGVEPVGPTTPASSDHASHPPRRLAPLAAAGIGVGALGLGGVVVGAILASKDDRLEPSPEERRELVGTDYATPGIAVLVSGSAVLVTGIALVVVGQVRHARRGRGSGDSRVTWGPAATRHGAGVRIMGRF